MGRPARPSLPGSWSGMARLAGAENTRRTQEVPNVPLIAGRREGLATFFLPTRPRQLAPVRELCAFPAAATSATRSPSCGTRCGGIGATYRSQRIFTIMSDAVLRSTALHRRTF